VIIAAPDQIAGVRKLARELTLDEIVAGMGDVDLVLTEGYKRAGKPAVEVIRASKGRTPLTSPERLVALVADCEVDLDVPCFNLAEVEALAALIEETLL
jgi:molybdopterin-guanine dinucleotide biosynthesis protein B